MGSVRYPVRLTCVMNSLHWYVIEVYGIVPCRVGVVVEVAKRIRWKVKRDAKKVAGEIDTNDNKATDHKGRLLGNMLTSSYSLLTCFIVVGPIWMLYVDVYVLIMLIAELPELVADKVPLTAPEIVAATELLETVKALSISSLATTNLSSTALVAAAARGKRKATSKRKATNASSKNDSKNTTPKSQSKSNTSNTTSSKSSKPASTVRKRKKIESDDDEEEEEENNDNDNDADNKVKGGQWKCSACQFANGAKHGVCELCGASRSSSCMYYLRHFTIAPHIDVVLCTYFGS
jgi:hypothetical protein